MKDGRTLTLKAFYRALAACAIAFGCAQTAGAQVANTSYRGAARDPFAKYKPPVPRKSEKKTPMPVQPPPIRARIENYKAQKMAAMSLQQSAPKPTTALLLGEVQVTGIFRTPRGYSALVEATPIKLSYVVYPGEAFYDGMLVAIEETRLVFRKQTRWTDGRVEVSVDTKNLRQTNAVADSLTATAPSTATVESVTHVAADGSKRSDAAAQGGAGKADANASTPEEGYIEVRLSDGRVLRMRDPGPLPGASPAEPAPTGGTGYWANRKAINEMIQNSPCPGKGVVSNGRVICQ